MCTPTRLRIPIPGLLRVCRYTFDTPVAVGLPVSRNFADSNFVTETLTSLIYCTHRGLIKTGKQNLFQSVVCGERNSSRRNTIGVHGGSQCQPPLSFIRPVLCLLVNSVPLMDRLSRLLIRIPNRIKSDVFVSRGGTLQNEPLNTVYHFEQRACAITQTHTVCAARIVRPHRRIAPGFGEAGDTPSILHFNRNASTWRYHHLRLTLAESQSIERIIQLFAK